MFENFTEQQLDVLEEALEIFYSKICDKLDELEAEFLLETDTLNEMIINEEIKRINITKENCLMLKQHAAIEAEARNTTQGDWVPM